MESKGWDEAGMTDADQVRLATVILGASVLTQDFEGLRLKPYKDTVGKTSIGFGRNLDDRGITLGEALQLLHNDLIRCYGECDASIPGFKDLARARQVVLVDMCYNMGIRGLMNFKMMIADVVAGDYEAAAGEMLSSKWAGQVRRRAVKLARIMKSGDLSAGDLVVA